MAYQNDTLGHARNNDATDPQVDVEVKTTTAKPQPAGNQQDAKN